MKMKNTGAICSAVLSLVSAGHLFAQSTSSQTTAGGVNAPASPITFGATLFSGSHTNINGNTAGGGVNDKFGAVVIPGFSLDYKSANFSSNLTYTAEIGSSRGTGQAFDGSKRWADNTYYIHDPVLTVTGGIAPDWIFHGTAEYKYSLANVAGQTTTDLQVSPDIEYKFNPNLGIAAGYWMIQSTGEDKVLSAANAGQLSSTKVEGKTKVSASVLEGVQNGDAGSKVTAFKGMALSAADAGQHPQTTIHQGVVWLRAKLAEDTTLNTYIRAGKRMGNSYGQEAYAYRLQSDLSTPVGIKALTAFVRYRLQADDVKHSDVTLLNLVDANLSYALNTRLSLDVANEFASTVTTKGSAKSTYGLETYAGATYKF